ncbi:MAG TPA: Gfo/Idh/MocA family oxidoreductase [bacterium]|nr:Gfo/Idh/MocA family oxidoreductase [bacterium]HOL47709.1 Gfo/Idh/MocA family oxidoreductase [bacterium]HPQ19069.1 Gfo/Idh/MocA family oxidoreductase [bacterium]
MNKKLRFGIIGCGRISYKHFQSLLQIPEVEIVAACDIDKKKAELAGKQYNIKYYYSYDEMLKNEEIDVVDILTPSGSHAEITIDIARKYKKHIIVEKPMALKLDDADKMIETCSQNNVKLFVVKQNRFNLPVIKLREAIEKNRFGKIVLATVRVRWCRDQKYYDSDSWRGTWKDDGGIFTNQASHHIDLLLWLVGPVESVFAQGITRLHNIEVEDTGAAILNFQNGALGIVEATTCTRPKDLEGSVSILGENGTVVISGFAVNKIETWEFKDKLPEDEEVKTKYSENPPNVYGFGHLEYLKNAVDSILNNKPVFVDGWEGRKSIELINAMYESIETDSKIYLRFKPKRSKLGLNEHNKK